MTARMHKNLKYKNPLLYQPLTKIRRQWSEKWREQVTFHNPPNRISIEKVQGRECFLIGLRNGLQLYHVTQTHSHDEDVEMNEYPPILSIELRHLKCPGTVLYIRYTTVVGAGRDRHNIASWSSKISRRGKQKSRPGAMVRCSLASPLLLSINFGHGFFPLSLNCSVCLLLSVPGSFTASGWNTSRTHCALVQMQSGRVRE